MSGNEFFSVKLVRGLHQQGNVQTQLLFVSHTFFFWSFFYLIVYCISTCVAEEGVVVLLGLILVFFYFVRKTQVCLQIK